MVSFCAQTSVTSKIFVFHCTSKSYKLSKVTGSEYVQLIYKVIALYKNDVCTWGSNNDRIQIFRPGQKVKFSVHNVY